MTSIIPKKRVQDRNLIEHAVN